MRQGRASDDYTPRIRRSNASYQTAMMAVRTPGCPCCLVAEGGRLSRPPWKFRVAAVRVDGYTVTAVVDSWVDV